MSKTAPTTSTYVRLADLQERMDAYLAMRRQDVPGMTVAPEAWSSIGFNLRPLIDALPALLRLVDAELAVRLSEDTFTDAYTSREAKAYAALLDARNDALDALVNVCGLPGPEGKA